MPGYSSATTSKYMRNWLVGVGVFELLLASGFLYGALKDKNARSGFLLTAAILGLVGLICVGFGLGSGRKLKEERKLQSAGLSGTATIVGMTQTGAYLNQNPQIRLDLEVAVPGRQPYRAQRTEWVPLMLLGRVGIGNILAVRVDPDNPSEMMIAWDQAPAMGGATMPSFAGSAGLVTGVEVPTQTGAESIDQVQAALQAQGGSIGSPAAGMGQVSIQQLREYVRATGLDGTGTLDMLQDTGQTVGTDRIFNCTMTVNVPGRAPNTSTSAMLVPQAAATKISQGVSVPVKVAKDNPDVVVVEWEKL